MLDANFRHFLFVLQSFHLFGDHTLTGLALTDQKFVVGIIRSGIFERHQGTGSGQRDRWLVIGQAEVSRPAAIRVLLAGLDYDRMERNSELRGLRVGESSFYRRGLWKLNGQDAVLEHRGDLQYVHFRGKVDGPENFIRTLFDV